jgi:6-pyruvoyltetrahydropterin/6-carboxytetrahydropterin synthase
MFSMTMLLTVSKRLEFSASRRLFVPRWSEEENLAAFGPETRARYGTGRNYVAYFIFAGPIDPTTGMLINISEIKARAGKVIAERYDHKFLNKDNPSFANVPPTAENIARQLYVDVAPLFSDVDAKLAACHLVESPDRSATFYSDGGREANFWFEFSAARQTMSPHLSNSENERLFGQAMSVHGHNYRARLTFHPQKLDAEMPFVWHDEIENCIQSVRGELDHRFLNRNVPGLENRPVTTESLAEYVYRRIKPLVPLDRIRLHEAEDFFAEVWDDESVFLGMRASFSAAHRLHVLALREMQQSARTRSSLCG